MIRKMSTDKALISGFTIIVFVAKCHLLKSSTINTPATIYVYNAFGSSYLLEFYNLIRIIDPKILGVVLILDEVATFVFEISCEL